MSDPPARLETDITIGGQKEDSPYKHLLELTPPLDSDDWVRILETRIQTSQELIRPLVNKLAQDFGPDSDQVKGFLLVTTFVTPVINEISLKQLQQFSVNPTPQSWSVYSPEAVALLQNNISEITQPSNPDYHDFWQRNSELREMLLVLSNELVTASDSDSAIAAFLKLEHLSHKIQANNRSINLIFPLGCDYTDPQHQYNQPLRIWEADMQFWLPLLPQEKAKIFALDLEAKQKMASLFNSSVPDIIPNIGNCFFVAGTDNFSAICGQAGIEKSYFWAVNLTDKNQKYWSKTRQLFPQIPNLEYSDQFKEMLRFLMEAHEVGHVLSRADITAQTGGSTFLDESRSDIPTVLAFLDKYQNELAIIAIVHEYAYEIADSTNLNSEWAKSYLASSNTILSLLEKSGLISWTNTQPPSLAIRAHPKYFEKFKGLLNACHLDLRGNKNLTQFTPDFSPITQKIIDFYRQP